MEIQRILEKLNIYYDEENFAEALRLIKYWIAEFEAIGDDRSRFTLLNELMGTYRKMGDRANAEKAAADTIELAKNLGIEDTPGGVMAYLNSGTVYKVFDQPHKALLCYQLTEKVFNAYLDPNDERFGGLYNNMGATLSDLERYEEAIECFRNAERVLSKIPGSDREQYIVNLNIQYLNEKINSVNNSGLAICRRYFEQLGKPMLESQFPELVGKLTVGLIGSGSECYGFDDEISRDHDFEPGFCIWIPGEDEVDRQTAFNLQRAYNSLPQEFEGLKRVMLSPVGGQRKGVIRIDDFVAEKIGDYPLTVQQWLLTPSYVFAEALNGEIWEDGDGRLKEVRDCLAVMPHDPWLKRLAGQLLIMGQSGQYNYGRCIDHGEKGAAGLALTEFVKAALEAVFLINNSYMPYYKWSFKAAKKLEILSDQAVVLEELISGSAVDTSECKEMIEGVCTAISDELRKRGISDVNGSEMERHAYALNGKIKDPEIRNLNILYTV